MSEFRQNQRASVTASAGQPAQGAAAAGGTGSSGGATAAKQPAKLIDAAAFSKILADVKGCKLICFLIRHIYMMKARFSHFGQWWCSCSSW